MADALILTANATQLGVLKSVPMGFDLASGDTLAGLSPPNWTVTVSDPALLSVTNVTLGAVEQEINYATYAASQWVSFDLSALAVPADGTAVEHILFSWVSTNGVKRTERVDVVIAASELIAEILGTEAAQLGMVTAGEGGGSTTLTVAVLDANDNSLEPGRYVVDTSGGPISAVLTSDAGEWVFYDPNGTTATNNLTISSGSDTFNGAAGPLVYDGGAASIVVARATGATDMAVTVSSLLPLGAADKAKLDNISVTQAVDLDAMEETLGHLTISQAVDLDAIELDVAQHQALLGVADGSTSLGSFDTRDGTLADDETLQTATQKFIKRIEEIGGINVMSLGATNDGTTDFGVKLKAAHDIATAAAVLVRPTAWATPTSITRSGATATVVTPLNHGLVTGDYVVIRGADQAEYNGFFEVTRVNDTTFTYQVTGTPASPATGTLEWREASGSSISRRMQPFVFCPPGKYRFDTVAQLDSADAMTVAIWAWGAVFYQGVNFPKGRCLIELGKPGSSVTANQPFFVDIHGATFLDFDFAIQAGFASANINIGRMALYDCVFCGMVGGKAEAVRAFNRSTSMHLVRCQWDRCRVAYENQSVDRVYIDHPRMQLAEYMGAADRNQFEGRFILRRGSMYCEKGTFNPNLNTPEEPTLKPMGWFLVQDFPLWVAGTQYRRGDIVQADGGVGTANISSISRTGDIATVTTSAAHGLRDGDLVVIEGADQADYNGTFRISHNPATNTTTNFAITVANTPTTPATGTMTWRKMQLWVCTTGDSSTSATGFHTAAGAFATDRDTHWLQVSTEIEGPLSVWCDLTVRDSLLGGEGGGQNPVIWDIHPDGALSKSSGTVTYPRTCRVVDCQVGSVARTGETRTNISSNITLRTARAVSSLTRVGTTATCVTGVAHGLTTGDKVYITGATQTEYNGEYVVTVTNTTTFTYTFAGSATATATGSIEALVAYVRSSSTTAYVKTLAAHGLFSGQKLTVSGATQSEYNVTASITVTGAKEFTYEFAGSGTTPATGTIVASNHLSVSPTVLWVQIPNRTEVRRNKYSFTQQVAADYWVAAASQPVPWSPTRFKPLEAIADGNHGSIQANHVVSGGTWNDVHPNYMPSDAVIPTYTASGTSMFIPTDAKIVKAYQGTVGTPITIYGFYGTYNGQIFTLLVNEYTTIANSAGFIQTYDGASFNPGGSPASKGLITFQVIDGIAYEISRSDLNV